MKLINADKLKEAINERLVNTAYEPFSAKDIYRLIDNAPTVEERPQGKNLNNEYDDVDQFICSICGIELQDWNRYETDEDTSEKHCYDYHFNYCPNCGADIRGAEK